MNYFRGKEAWGGKSDGEYARDQERLMGHLASTIGIRRCGAMSFAIGG